jgi:CSLREA domain-containing protein
MNLPRFRAIILSLPLFAAFTILPPAAQAATTFTVTTTTDDTTSDGSCTLREAVLAANGSPANTDCGADGGMPYTVSFAISGTITLGSTLPNIARNMTIDGAGQSVTVSGNHTVRVFTVNGGVTFNLQTLTVANGHSYNGGGIFNSGTLNVTSCTISNNRATYYGGGIYNSY